MQDIVLRRGIIHIEIKGVHMLVADREARQHCLYVRVLNETASFLWELLENGYSYEKIIAAFLDRYEIDDPTRIEQDISLCIEQLAEKGYLCGRHGGAGVDQENRESLSHV